MLTDFNASRADGSCRQGSSESSASPEKCALGQVRNLERRTEVDMLSVQVARYLQERLTTQPAWSRSGSGMSRMPSRSELPTIPDDAEGSDDDDQPDIRERGRRRRDRR